MAEVLTAEQKSKLEKAGIDWQKWGEKLAKALPLLLALAELVFSDNPAPIYKGAGHDHSTHKERLQAILQQQLCAAHCLSHEISECCD